MQVPVGTGMESRRRVDAEKMRVLHVAKHCGYGNGNVHVAVDLACVQAEAGYDVTFASGGGTFVPMLEEYGVKHVTLPQNLKRPLEMARSARRLLSLCRRTRPAIVHAHMTAGAILGRLASWGSGAALVNTVHNSFDPQSAAMRFGDRIVAVSQAEREHLIRSGWPASSIVAVNNAPDGSPRERFMHNDTMLQLRRPCLGLINALHHRKGVHDVIDAFAALASKFPDWTLVVAGEGPDRGKLEAQARALGLSDRVDFVGFVRAPKYLFAQVDVFVLASYADPGSLAIGEARASGCAIIATAVGGTPEMLDHGASGRLVPPGRPDKLAEEMAKLMADGTARAALQEAARQGSEAFHVDTLVDRYQEVYLQAMAVRKRLRPGTAEPAIAPEASRPGRSSGTMEGLAD